MYAAMLPRLQAEESLREVARVGIGVGTGRIEDRQANVNQWKRLVDGRSSAGTVGGFQFPIAPEQVAARG